MTSDLSNRPVRDLHGLTVPQCWAVAVAIGSVIGGTFLAGYWLGTRDRPGVTSVDCRYTNYRINGRTWPSPGQVFEIESSPVNLEWESSNCSGTVQTYYGGALAWSAQVYSPVTVELNKGPGDYEIKLWDQTPGHPPLRIGLVSWKTRQPQQF